MRKVSLERYYFVLYNGALTLKMSKMVLYRFAIKLFIYCTCISDGPLSHCTNAGYESLSLQRLALLYPRRHKLMGNVLHEDGGELVEERRAVLRLA